MRPCPVSNLRFIQVGSVHSQNHISLWLLHQPFASATGWRVQFGDAYSGNCVLGASHKDDKRETCTALPDSTSYDQLCCTPFTAKQISNQVYTRDTLNVHCFASDDSGQFSPYGTAGELPKPLFTCSVSDYAVYLQRCCRSGSLFDGKIVHDQIVRNGYEQNSFISNCLGYMYGHYGALQEVCALFSRMHIRDIYSWNFLIRTYALHEQGKEALHAFQKMHLSNISPDKFSFVSILSACEDLVNGMLLHTSVIEYQFERDILVGNALINFYGKCGSIEDAHKIFDLMRRKDHVSWNSLISVYAQYGETMAFILYRMMNLKNVPSDRITYITLLSASANETALFEGQCFHASILGNDFVSDIAICNSLINMYGKCSLLEDAWSCFREMPRRDIISWNAIINAYSYNHDGKRALQLYFLLRMEGLVVNKVTMIAVLDACTCEGFLAEGKRTHAFIINGGIFSDVSIASALVHMYSKCKSLLDAQKVFEHHVDRNLLMWNTITTAYSQSEEKSASILMFERMLCECVLPNHITFVNIISGCSNQETLFDGKRVHAVIFANDNVWGDIGVGTSLVHMYGKHGLLRESEKLFWRLPVINVVTWNALLAAYSEPELLDRVQEFCSLIYLQGLLPDKVTFISALSACAHPSDLVVGRRTHTHIIWSMCNTDVAVASALINMYGKCDALQDACKIFESTHCRSISCWNALLGAYSQNEYGVSTLLLLDRMQREGVISDKVTYLSILGGNSMQITEADVQRLHVYLSGSNIEPDSVLGSAFISMYGKLGKPEVALKMFIAGPKYGVESWNSLITVLAQTGYGNESFQLYFNMQEKLIIPKAEHYNCMVDLFGRAGMLKEAEHMINRMPFDPLITPLLILLSACKSQKDVQTAERVTYVAITADPDDPTSYIILRNIYSTLNEGETTNS